MLTADEILSSSDWHLQPEEELFPAAKSFLEMAATRGTRTVLNGDILDLIIHGVRAYQGSLAIKSLRAHLPPQGVDLILGNHSGRLAWLLNLLGDEPGVRIVRSLDIVSGDRIWHFEHGDRLSLDWGWLRPAYQGVADIMMAVSPALWIAFCRRMGWVPSAYRWRLGESQKYQKLTGTIWSNALEYAQSHNVNVGIGHTHTAVVIETAFATVADSGDMRDCQFTLIEKGKAYREAI